MMSAKSFSELLQENYRKVEETNERLRIEYEKNHDQKVFEQYFMSELLPPIEDFTNAIRLLRANFCYGVNTDLLIVGAENIYYWTHEENDFLKILNVLYPHLSEEQKAIVCYQNAEDFACRNENYQDDPRYEAFLRQSIAFDVPFVYNRRALARICKDPTEAKTLYREAISQVRQAIARDEELPWSLQEEDLHPRGYIENLILGVSISKSFVEDMKKEMEELET